MEASTESVVLVYQATYVSLSCGVCLRNVINSIVLKSALVSTCGIGAQLQPGGRLGQDELESLRSLWDEVIDDLHFYKLVPFAIDKMEHLCGQRGVQFKHFMLLHMPTQTYLIYFDVHIHFYSSGIIIY